MKHLLTCLSRGCGQFHVFYWPFSPYCQPLEKSPELAMCRYLQRITALNPSSRINIYNLMFLSFSSALACLLWFSVGITWISYMFRNNYNLPKDYGLIIKCILVIPVMINIIMIDFSFNTGVGLMLGNQIASYFFLGKCTYSYTFNARSILPV